MDCRIIPMPQKLWAAVREIYAEGIATGNATFETELPSWEQWDRIHRKDCRLVAVEPLADGDTETLLPLDRLTALGWAALSPVSSRRVYTGVAEVSVYVAVAARGCGVGRALLKALVDESERNGIWTLQAGIFPENTVSLALHKSCGFRKVGVRRRVGKLHDRWRDVISLERRSLKVGV